MTLDAYSTILRPVVSEKSTLLGDHGKYIFEVAPGANKIQIKHAIEEAFANSQHHPRHGQSPPPWPLRGHDPLLEESHRDAAGGSTARPV